MRVLPSKLEIIFGMYQKTTPRSGSTSNWCWAQLTPATLFLLAIPPARGRCNFTIARFHIRTVRKRHNKMYLIFARSPRRCRGVYWCRVLLAWGLPKYQSHTRLQIIYVYIARAHLARHLHDDETSPSTPKFIRCLVLSRIAKRLNIFNSPFFLALIISYYWYPLPSTRHFDIFIYLRATISICRLQ